MKRYKHKILFGALIIAIITFVFWYGGDAPGLRGWTVEPNEPVTVVSPEEPQELKKSESTEENMIAVEDTKQVGSGISDTEAHPPVSTEVPQQVLEQHSLVMEESPEQDRYLTDPVPEGKPLPVEPQDQSITNQEYTCFLSVRCDTIFNNMSWLDPEKVELIPSDGVIFAEREVIFYEGESVFDVLLREMKQNKIHMEYESTPIYNSAYIEGIANLYEFDCGELSGWMYKVNGWFPNYGCSRYQLMPGDRIEWVYTCDLGADVGGSYSVGNGEQYE